MMVLVLFSSPVLFAQALLLKDYSTEDGLPDSRVAPLLQDREGYLWFCTQAGLTRYDGNEFLNFGPAHEIPGIFGRSILQDHAGAIWFAYSGFRSGGLTRYWNGRKDTIDLPPGTQPNEIVEDAGGNIWVASNIGFQEIRFEDSLRTAWTIRPPIDSAVSAAFVSRNGDLYFADKQGLSLLRGHDVIPLYQAPAGSGSNWHVRPYSFYETTDGDLWFGGYYDAYRIQKGRLQRFGPDEGIPDRGVWCFNQDENGNLFAGTMNGLYRIRDGGGKVVFEKEPSFGDAVVYDMLRDREGNLWFASAPGLRRLLRLGTVVPFKGEEVLAAAGVGPIQNDADGAVYFGSRNTGLYTYRDATVLPPVVPLPTHALTVTAVAPDGGNNSWVGLWRGGVVHLWNGHRRAFTTADGLPSDGVHCVMKTRKGTVIVGTAAGACMIDTQSRLKRFDDPQISGRTIFDVKEGTDDTLWFGTDDGVREGVLKEDSLLAPVTIPATEGLTGKFVYAVLVDSRRRVWFGTDGSGVIVLDRGRYSKITTEDGLVSDRVFALAEDSVGNVWVGTAAGLSCCSGRCVRSLTYAQGFGEIGMHGLLTDRRGDLWVSCVPGVKKLRPAHVMASTLPPSLSLTDVTVDGTHLDLRHDQELRPDPAIIIFRFAALSYTDERNVRYRYSLDGFDRDWSPPVTSREVRYTHLPPGHYRFRLIARSGDGVWSPAPEEYAFAILPPFWTRWWFVSATLLLIGASLYGGYRYRLNRILQLQQTRNRIAMDLHDDVGSSLTRISVMTEVARRKAGEGDGETTEYLSHIGEIARSIIDSLGDIVWTVDPSHDDLQDVIRRIVQFGEEVCAARGIAFETDLSGSFDSARLEPEKRRDIYLVFKEGINNIVKHSGATIARFRVRPGRGTAVLELLDNGSGIPGDAEGTGHGLVSLKTRGERAGTRFSVESREGEGTRISLEIKTG